ncbi:MAG TPA: tetratricopeptide repeat protein [Pseudomonadota bacterium]|nr:tetratricopeptide repeat protein [Pseudomonadota bacterium]
MNLIAELRRRKVIQVGAAYLVVAWLLIQIVATVAPQLQLPEWVPRLVTLLLMVGFPVAVVMAWVFEVMPEGVRVDARKTGSKRMYVSAAVLAAAALAWYVRGDRAAQEVVVAAPSAPTAAPAPPATSASTTAAPADPVAPPPTKSIAVLAFADMSPDKDSEYLSDGIAEEILNALAGVGDLQVAARTSSFYYKDRNESLRDIGKTLGVAHVLEGSVRRQGEKVRITAQLIRVADGFHRWSDTYDGDLADVFALQERIARAITDELKVVLSGGQQEQLVDVGTDNAAAYGHYLRGRYFWNRRTAANISLAIEQFRAAADADPEFAKAYSGIADCYAILPYYASIRSDQTIAQARIFAARALALDEGLAEAHTSSAFERVTQWDWSGAEQAFRRAIELNPRYATAHFWYARMLAGLGRYDDALERLREAHRLEPLSRVIRDNLTQFHILRNEPAIALVEARRLVELAPDYPSGHALLGRVLLLNGKPDEALIAVDRAIAMETGIRARLARIAALVALGRHDEAASLAREYEGQHAVGNLDAYWVANAYVDLGDDGQALAWLERAIAERSALVSGVRADTSMLRLRDDPRFRAIIARMGMPE